MKPFFARIGSKTTLLKYIMPLFPQHTTYCEPFVGGGAVFFKKTKSEIEILNDIDKTLYDDYMHLKNVRLENIPDSIEDLNEFYKNAEDSPTNKLLKSLLIRNNTFNCSGKGKLYPKSNPLNKLKLVPEYQLRLKNAIFHNKSYEDILRDYDSENTFFYIDPPYENSKGFYTHYTFDYQKLVDILKSIKGKFLLSINDSPRIRELFQNYKIVSILVQKTGGSKKLFKLMGFLRSELLISNY